MVYVIDIVLLDENHDGINAKLEVWSQTRESNGFRLSRTKTKYVECKFSDVTPKAGMEVRLHAQTIQKKRSFKYLGSIIPETGRLMVMHTSYWCMVK
ncbi:hypothetical protein H5410_020542 [Solanum commersonii]|uniref:Uncharacterized protein n=1 Tax=Solanum commersonii TaxID=4109 RepID=A0A9J5ZAA0_SOLCO|nr:hypothetical protein H5410_020542 [Solanum commersonii]